MEVHNDSQVLNSIPQRVTKDIPVFYIHLLLFSHYSPFPLLFVMHQFKDSLKD